MRRPSEGKIIPCIKCKEYFRARTPLTFEILKHGIQDAKYHEWYYCDKCVETQYDKEEF